MCVIVFFFWNTEFASCTTVTGMLGLQDFFLGLGTLVSIYKLYLLESFHNILFICHCLFSPSTKPSHIAVETRFEHKIDEGCKLQSYFLLIRGTSSVETDSPTWLEIFRWGDTSWVSGGARAPVSVCLLATVPCPAWWRCGGQCGCHADGAEPLTHAGIIQLLYQRLGANLICKIM